MTKNGAFSIYPEILRRQLAF